MLRAAEALDAPSAACVPIGDSLADVRAVHAAGGAAVGYADKPHKRQALVEAGAEAVTEDMRALAHVLRPGSPGRHSRCRAPHRP
ncbi:HAD hydrolase-like protein [Streptomyces sp. enrichment culture]|uniref:HAD hydrolase-like protein n=1 Tax=Streptomyces sp. enrichment culture TaxID=1795815 RepID=UPI003F55220D